VDIGPGADRLRPAGLALVEAATSESGGRGGAGPAPPRRVAGSDAIQASSAARVASWTDTARSGFSHPVWASLVFLRLPSRHSACILTNDDSAVPWQLRLSVYARTARRSPITAAHGSLPGSRDSRPIRRIRCGPRITRQLRTVSGACCRQGGGGAADRTSAKAAKVTAVPASVAGRCSRSVAARSPNNEVANTSVGGHLAARGPESVFARTGNGMPRPHGSRKRNNGMSCAAATT
jgi:hypothetical protein